MAIENIQNISVDTYKDELPKIYAKQYEKNSRQVIVKCKENGEIKELDPNTMICNIKMLTPDNRAIYNSCKILDNGTVAVDISESMVHASGNAKAELNILDNNSTKMIATMDFILVIKPSPYPDDKLIASDEFNILLKTLEEINETKTSIIELENRISFEEKEWISNEKIRESNESNRISAETTRINAENSRISNENERISDENERKSNENKRANAEEIRINAENSRISNEEKRESNERIREENETTRINSEKERVSSENQRISAENTRIENERNRINQENDRQTASSNAVKQAETATLKADKATASCEEVIGRAEDTLQTQQQLNSTLNTVLNSEKNISNIESNVESIQKQVEADKEEIDQTINDSLLASSEQILEFIQDYYNRANELYNSIYLDCDGETPQLRSVTIVKIYCGSPQYRINNSGILFDGGTPLNRVMGS